ncbi:DUF7261 family protein [Halalkalicoccus subterraneus]|uniref:DUF7261 family protein n=1 Tax=Halalkalicoccus subterraneus TaxID=2675002 RepID=UPI000EFC0524|nr:hypothetical protein [Halalkalicoccus subterraneus]
MAAVADERGQLVLVAGFAIAATFVVLALVLNGVIYAEGVGTRTTDVGERDALAAEDLAVAHVAATLPTSDEGSFEAAIESWAEQVLAHEVRSGATVDVEIVEIATDEAVIEVTYETAALTYRSGTIAVTSEGRR